MPATPTTTDVAKAAAVIKAGGVLAYPTETVFGLGCLPNDAASVARILRLKGRSAEKGLILIASQPAQLTPYTGTLSAHHWEQIAAASERPTTWLVPAAPDSPAWITGAHTSIAIRVSHWPITQALCDACGSALVSTSANLAGNAPTTNAEQLDTTLIAGLDLILLGECADTKKPSMIRDLMTGNLLRE